MASSTQPVADENTFAASITATTSMNKFRVPSSDRRLVLSAIDNQLHLAKDAWGEKNFNSDQQTTLSNGTNNNNNCVARGEFFMNCINETGASLHRQLELVTTPVEETEVESMLDSFQTRLATATLQLNSDANNCDDDDDEEEEEDVLSSSSDDDEEEEFEFDDADIVDAEAYQQVKQLRSKARGIASRIVSVREETVGRAMEMTQRNLLELMRVHGFDNENNIIHSQDGIGSEQQAEEETKNDEEKNSSGSICDNLKPLRMALHTLVSSLHHVDSNLGENLESLKETIGTIGSSVEKIQRHLKGDENALSRTEKALLASSSVNPEEDTTLVGVVDIVDKSAIAKDAEMTAMMNPDKKLAHLLAGIL